MSLLDWFSSKKKSDALSSVLPSSGLSRLESTKPAAHAARHAGMPPAGNRKQERLERRELLYLVVREAMVRAGVLTSSYKFKVLSLDPRGRQFLVMVDLAHGGGHDTARLAEIEAMVAQSAKARFDILVTAVYWRANEHVAIGDPKMAVRQGSASRPAPLEALPRRADPVHPSEVAAFKQALGARAKGEAALAALPDDKQRGEQSYTLLTGFEDTEMATSDDPALGKTQYGELR